MDPGNSSLRRKTVVTVSDCEFLLNRRPGSCTEDQDLLSEKVKIFYLQKTYLSMDLLSFENSIYRRSGPYILGRQAPLSTKEWGILAIEYQNIMFKKESSIFKSPGLPSLEDQGLISGASLFRNFRLAISRGHRFLSTEDLNLMLIECLDILFSEGLSLLSARYVDPLSVRDVRLEILSAEDLRLSPQELFLQKNCFCKRPRSLVCKTSGSSDW